MRASAVVLALLAAGACRAEPEAAVAVPGGDAAAGRALVRAYGCQSCHLVPGVRGPGGRVGPPLAGFAGRIYVAGNTANTPENLVRFLQDPRAVSPESAMPDVGVTEEHARHIAAYLYRLR